MRTSIFLARLIGPLFAGIGARMLVIRSILAVMAHEFQARRALTYVWGSLALLAGLAIVSLYNVWLLGWAVFITDPGWLTLLSGIRRMVFPDRVKVIGAAVVGAHGLLMLVSFAPLGLRGDLKSVGYRA